MEHATHNTTLEIIDPEYPDPGHTAFAGTTLTETESAPRSAHYRDSEIPEASPALAAESAPLIEIVPESIVAAELGESPHCLPAHWPRKAPAP